jgi:phosphoribosylanthranilate isomerase
MGKITMLKNVNDGINYHKAGSIVDVSSDIEKWFISNGWAIKSSKKVEEVIQEEIEEIIDPVINEEYLEIVENID